MDSLTKLRRGINRISFLLCLTPAALAARPEYLVAAGGSYSVGSTAANSDLAITFSDFRPEYSFTDYGGKFYRLHAGHGFGFSLGLVSAMNARALYTAASSAVGEYVQRLNSAEGGGHYLVTGKYSLGLGWVPLLARYRYSWAGDLVFVEAGAGPAYGFGALDSSISASNGGATKTETRYHKYSEWGFITNLTLGTSWQLAPGLSLQLLAEVAWLYARVRDPNLFVPGSTSWSQFFVRPGLAVAFSF